mmetsp:Transcript_31998/g.83836  ORF Transcript_31998/g.83836 Transcript_31998/m.83836 type:complete len:283 (+) Transcript_31998:1900-2748(+)
MGPDHCHRLDLRALQWKRISDVLDKGHSLAGCQQCKCAMGQRVDTLWSVRAVRVGLIRVEHAETNLHAEKVAHGFFADSVGHSAVIDGRVQRTPFAPKKASAIVVHASAKCDSGSFVRCVRVVVCRVYIANSTAVGRNISVEAPLSTQCIVEQRLGCTRRHAIDRVIRAHDTRSVASIGARSEGRKVRVGEVLLRNDGVEMVAVHRVGVRRAVRAPLLEVVSGIVLAAAGCFQKIRIFSSLEPTDKAFGVVTVESGIFSRALLSSAPSRVAEDVDVRSPKSK